MCLLIPTELVYRWSVLLMQSGHSLLSSECSERNGLPVRSHSTDIWSARQMGNGSPFVCFQQIRLNVCGCQQTHVSSHPPPNRGDWRVPITRPVWKDPNCKDSKMGASVWNPGISSSLLIYLLSQRQVSDLPSCEERTADDHPQRMTDPQ